ncbi:hypothetical protein [Streptomyces sp. NPDC048392]|uniref:hypothetical protein n=1 Tax=Streptomyces sp. NPDC048392 TaxID=3365543 RepID=UPI003716BFD6
MTAGGARTADRAESLRREFGTGLLTTVVTGLPDGGYRWQRRNGLQSPAPFAPVPDSPAEAAGDVGALGPGDPAPPEDGPGPKAARTGDRIRQLRPDGAVRWVVGEAEGADRVYRVRGPESVAGRLLREGPDEQLATTLHGLGRALRALHALPVPQDVGSGVRPRGLVRLDDWLAGRSPSPRAAYAESFLRPRLGDAHLSAVRELSAELTAGPGNADTVLCHGAPGLGALIPAAAGTGARGEADMLIGEDLCPASWQFDVGWTLGELVELKWYRGGDRPEQWSASLRSFFQGYGRDLGDAWARHAALRVLLHLHDYTSYVGWDQHTVEKYTGFVKFLLDT